MENQTKVSPPTSPPNEFMDEHTKEEIRVINLRKVQLRLEGLFHELETLENTPYHDKMSNALMLQRIKANIQHWELEERSLLRIGKMVTK